MTYNVTLKRSKTIPLYEYQFAICESCFWCATVFHNKSIIIKQEHEEDIVDGSSNNNNFQQLTCALCKNKNILLTPLSKD
jgi:hypothetical protein